MRKRERERERVWINMRKHRFFVLSDCYEFALDYNNSKIIRYNRELFLVKYTINGQMDV